MCLCHNCLEMRRVHWRVRQKQDETGARQHAHTYSLARALSLLSLSLSLSRFVTRINRMRQRSRYVVKGLGVGCRV